ncbi:hypothetical protein KAF25_000279 [Fusarium avenaceum]|uniref:Enoyl reductase (ER) domain-containing protein n=1 Tax=Fusarium avenaceum TaxID=40199 RepID=A0A9P7H608_9HYPO|nr:hypothetical protein KAF25_000279 [Fusarium avenaceum]
MSRPFKRLLNAAGFKSSLANPQSRTLLEFSAILIPAVCLENRLIFPGPKVDIVDSPIPVAQKGQVLIHVMVSGSNPKDFKAAYFLPLSNLGDDIAGYVKSVGPGVSEYRPGDRVAAFHQIYTPHGAFAEYAIAWANSTFRIPDTVSFEEAATIPLTAMTAAIGLYSNLRLPDPWTTEEDRPKSLPLVIYGAGAAVGSFAVQLARKSEVHPIICVAGQSKDYVETLIDRSKGDTIVDYRLGPKVVVTEIKKALGGMQLLHAFDSVAEHGSDKILGALLEPQNARLAMVLPYDRTKIPKSHGVPYLDQYELPVLEGVPEGVEVIWTAVGSVHGSHEHFGYVFFRYLALGLEEGWFKPHPYLVVPGGLNGLARGLADLHKGKAHAVKYVYRISETEGLDSFVEMASDAKVVDTASKDVTAVELESKEKDSSYKPAYGDLDSLDRKAYEENKVYMDFVTKKILPDY